MRKFVRTYSPFLVSTVLFLAVVQIYCIAIGVQFWHKLV